MAVSLDTEEDRRLLEATLSTRLGREVVVNKVANLVSVHAVVRTAQVLAEVSELEILVAHDPIGLLVEKASREETLPVPVCLRRDQLLRPGPALYAVPGAPSSLAHPSMYVMTEEGVVQLATYSSAKVLDLRVARNQLSDLLRGMDGGGVTVVAMGEGFREYQDEVTSAAQVWFDGVVLPGRWAWDEVRSMMVRRG